MSYARGGPPRSAPAGPARLGKQLVETAAELTTRQAAGEPEAQALEQVEVVDGRLD